MQHVAGTTSQELALWRRDDKTVFGLMLHSDYPRAHLGEGECSFVGVLPKGTPIAKFERSRFEGHYECILGVNALHLPVAAVQGTPHDEQLAESRPTVRQRNKTAR